MWAHSSAGRALHSHCRGQEFDSPWVHHNVSADTLPSPNDDIYINKTRSIKAPGNGCGPVENWTRRSTEEGSRLRKYRSSVFYQNSKFV